MPNPSMVFPRSPVLPYAGAARACLTRSPPIHVLARFAFWTIFILSLTNAIGVYVGIIKRVRHDETYELSAYPIIFGVCTVIVLAFSRGRLRSTLLVVAWVYWLLYFLGGFLGVLQITTIDLRSTLRVTVKPWMAIIGLPWLALRAISEDKVPRLIHVSVVLICFGAVIGFLQILVPGFMEGMLANPGRAEGLWTIPGTAGAICAMGLFLSLLSPFKSRVANWTTRLILVGGVASTLSLGAIAAMLVAWVVYAICARQFWTLLKSTIALALFWVIALAVLEVTEVATKAGHEQERLSSVRAFLSLEFREKTLNSRTELWEAGLNSIMSRGGFLFGLGHGSMARIVVTESQEIGPHNYYIYVLGNSGVFALFGFLALHFVLVQQAFKLPDRQARAAVIAIATVWAVYDFADNVLVEHSSFGAIFACVTVIIAYARPRQMARRRVEQSNLAHPRPM
jgi:O-antigen ligase